MNTKAQGRRPGSFPPKRPPKFDEDVIRAECMLNMGRKLVQESEQQEAQGMAWPQYVEFCRTNPGFDQSEVVSGIRNQTVTINSLKDRLAKLLLES